MKFEKSIIVALCLCLLMIGSVSATSDNDTMVSSDVSDDSQLTVKDDNHIIEENPNDEVIGSSEKEVKSAPDDGTFTALQNKINNAADGFTINLENDYMYNDGFKTSGITISKTITINGNGKTINAQGKSRIFYIYNNVHLTLENLHIINGNKEQGGGAIYNKGTLTVTNSQFTNNQVTGTPNGFGGAIENYEGTVIVIDSTFTNNQVYGEQATGGAIYSQNGILTVTNSQFNNNQAIGTKSFGGAIDTYKGSLTVKNTIFDKNRANGKSSSAGNAIYISDGNNANIHNCKFDEKNDVYCPSGKVDLSDSQFTKTQSTSTKTKKSKLKVSAPSVINSYKKSQKFKVKIKNNGKAIKGLKVIIKVYTGKKYKKYILKTNKRGITSINTKSLSKGKHKVITQVNYEKNKITEKSTITIKSKYYTFKWGKYKITITNKQYQRIEKAKHGSTYRVIKNTGKYKKYKVPKYKIKKVKKQKYVYKYKLASRVTLYESWSYSSAYKTPKGYVFVGTKTVDCGDYEYRSYIKYRSKKKKTYYKKVKVKVGYKTKKTPIKICVGADEMQGAYLNIYYQYYAADGYHWKDYVFKELKI